jgi:hypothetical protein
MNWVRSVLPSLWMKLSLPSENSPAPPIPERMLQGLQWMQPRRPTGQSRLGAGLPRSMTSTESLVCSPSQAAAKSPAGPPPTMMTSKSVRRGLVTVMSAPGAVERAGCVWALVQSII